MSCHIKTCGALLYRECRNLRCSFFFFFFLFSFFAIIAEATEPQGKAANMTRFPYADNRTISGFSSPSVTQMFRVFLFFSLQTCLHYIFPAPLYIIVKSYIQFVPSCAPPRETELWRGFSSNNHARTRLAWVCVTVNRERKTQCLCC